jgi:hypothetical protein
VDALSGPKDAYPCFAEDVPFDYDLLGWTAEDIERHRGMVMPNVVIGVDIGQKVDPSAVCVCEPEEREVDGRRSVHYVVRHLERLPLGTPYPGVAERVAAVVGGVRRNITPGRGISTYVDSTGVGSPLVDLIKAAGVRCRPVFFTWGDRRLEQDDGSITLGKAWLVSRLQVLLQCGRVLLPRTAEADALARELLDFEIKVDQDANEKYGSFKVGSHDDLVTALGLAVQDEPKVRSIIWG